MTCKHDWHFIGNTSSLQCQRCNAASINWRNVAIPAEQLQGYRFQETQPTNSLLFYGKVNGQQTEVMRISKDGILVNPDVPVDEAAKKVLEAIDHNIKRMVEQVRKEEREACANLCWKNEDDNAFANAYNGKRLDLLCAELIRARGKE